MKDLFHFQDKNFLVTGSSRGIGEAVAHDLLDLGANVWGVSRTNTFNPERSGADRFGFIPADLSNPSDRSAISESGPEQYDGIFLNAGASGSIKPFHLVNEAELRDLFELNFYAPYLLIQDLYKKKKIRPGCSIVVNTAHAAFFQPAASSAYTGAKGALQGAFRSVAADMAKRKIRVNFIAFGYVDTELLRKNNVPDETKALAPLGVPAPSEIAGGAIYLLSPASRWLSGTTILASAGLGLKQVPML
jgi:NAD(P)-dependent dehydrogenase (short-subunit alcohol dehydrogenase family)